MSQFISGKELEDAVCEVIWNAKETLLIVSPYIKLDDYFKKLFSNHLNNPSLEIILVFGKNESSIGKSMAKGDFDFFKSFPNVSIVYVPNLHAKYYANESTGILTSINLYDYSFKNNIEFGIMTKHSGILGIGGAADKDAWDKCFDIANSHDVIFIKRPVYQKNLLSALLGKKYIKSDILFDCTSEIYGMFKKSYLKKRLDDFPHELELGSSTSSMPSREEVEPTHGFCIRTGVKIKYDLKSPYCYTAYESWSKFKNPDYPEKYCHRTGKPSNGKTSMRKPVLG